MLSFLKKADPKFTYKKMDDVQPVRELTQTFQSGPTDAVRKGRWNPDLLSQDSDFLESTSPQPNPVENKMVAET